MSMTKNGLLVLVLVAARIVVAQEFSIKKIEVTGENIVFHYDLVDTTKNRLYTVRAFTSKDDFLNPLIKVKGDVGLEVRPGINKKIVWDPKELGAAYKGDVEVEVRGKVYIPFVQFTNLQDTKAIKRGKPTTLLWTGGTRQNILNFTLYREEEVVTVISNIANSGNYDIVIPKSVKPGTGYYFIVSDTKNKDLIMKTSEFAVKRKTKTIFKIIPIAIAGGVIYTLLPKPAPEALENPSGPPTGKN
jgi:hypothetical protein